MSNRSSRLSISALIVLGLALFAFGMSAVLSRAVFERLPHLEDEMAYLWGARAIAGGSFVLPTPQPARSYWQPFIVDRDGVRFSKYTPGWSMQLAFGVIAGQPWIVNALAAALTVGLTYRSGRLIFGGVRGRRVGVIAAGLVAFSPAALLLNATLMGHTTALCAAAIVIVSLLQIERAALPRQRLAWGFIGGIALGLLALNRPLTAVAVGAPLGVWVLVGQLRELLHYRDLGASLRALTPFGLLAAVALALALIIPIYNYQAAGDPGANLYTFVWEYDRIGFGECCGRSGHTLEKGVRHMRFDLSLTAADLFGWHAPVTGADGQVAPELVDHWVNQADYLPTVGWSWLLLPAGIIVAFGKRSFGVAAWLAIGLLILALPFSGDGAYSRVPAVGWAVVIGLLAWAVAPLLVIRDRQRAWAWLLISVALCLIIVQLAYWIGSQRYSTRYYYEGVISAALISALPLAALVGWLERRGWRMFAYGLVPGLTGAALIGSLFAYSLPRVGVLNGFNLINRELIAQVEQRREGDRPVLVLVNGSNVRWRAYAPLMALTSPYLDSAIVAARAATDDERRAILARFADRQVIEMDAVENQAEFREPLQPGVTP